MTAKEINKILRRYIPSGTVLGTTREKLIYELQDLHQREVNKLNLPNVSNNEVAVCSCTGNPLKYDWCVRCDLFNKCKLAVRQTDC